jgi:hypothetical protein
MYISILYIWEGCHNVRMGKEKIKEMSETRNREKIRMYRNHYHVLCFHLPLFSCNFIHSSIIYVISSSEYHIIIKEKRLSVCFWILKSFKRNPYKHRVSMLSSYPLKLWNMLDISRSYLLHIKSKLFKWKEMLWSSSGGLKFLVFNFWDWKCAGIDISKHLAKNGKEKYWTNI